MLTLRRRRSKHAASRYPVMSDKPIWIHDPQRKMGILAVLFGLAIAVSSVAGAVVATTLANEQTSDSKQQLLDDIERGRRLRDQEASRFQNALDVYRRDQCEVTARLPQDPPIVDIRRRYRCDNPVATPTPTPTPSASTAGTGRAGPASRAPGPHPTGPPGAAGPARPPAGGPQPPPEPVPVPQPPAPVPMPPPTPGPPLCLPILGICLI